MWNWKATMQSANRDGVPPQYPRDLDDGKCIMHSRDSHDDDRKHPDREKRKEE
jgi:hypothetical protein